MQTDYAAPSSSSSAHTPMPVATNTSTSQTLSEEQVIDGFHTFLQSALTKAKTGRLLDADTLASAEADLMISGPAICLFFGGLRSTTDPPSVPLPRSRFDISNPLRRLSRTTCPPAFASFIQVWAATVPFIQALPPPHLHDLARVICDLPALATPAHPGINRIAADLRAVAIEISQRRTFQERYRVDLQAALDAGQVGRGGRRGEGATAQFMPPPMYDENDASSTGSRTPEPEPDQEPQAERERESDPPEKPDAADPPEAGSTLSQTTSALTLIRETLFAALADVISSTPSLHALLSTDPARAYFSSVALAILRVALTALTPAGAVLSVLGRELTLQDCPEALRPLMRELAAVGAEAKICAEEDDADAIRLVGEGRVVPQPRMERVVKMLESGVGWDERERSPDADEHDGRRSVEGRAVQFANRVNRLALTMTGLPAFQAYAKDVFEVLRALG